MPAGDKSLQEPPPDAPALAIDPDAELPDVKLLTFARCCDEGDQHAPIELVLMGKCSCWV
jgi:hypothetical protein